MFRALAEIYPNFEWNYVQQRVFYIYIYIFIFINYFSFIFFILYFYSLFLFFIFILYFYSLFFSILILFYYNIPCLGGPRWHLPENRKAFFENFAKKHDFDALKLENWFPHYKEIVATKVLLSPLLSHVILTLTLSSFP
jgi:cellulose synthase/poly-beta-1,6-N-acetylglucosamine synthase-like glycosyltransferase